MNTIVVIGGGITGLSTMYYLQKALKGKSIDARLVLVEASETLGGKIRTVRQKDFIIETGADSIVARKANMVPFLEELKLTEKIVYNATGISYIYTDGQLKKIPEDAVFGIPTSIESLLSSDIVSDAGKAEALKDLSTTNESFTLQDSLGLFLEHFLGQELVQKQIAPVISGVYSGELNDLTIASTFPYLLEYKNQYGSIIRGLSENKEKFLGNGSKKFISFEHGVNALIDTLEERLTDVEIWKGIKVVSIEKDQDKYCVRLSDSREIEANMVVLSTLHSAAQSMLNSEELDKDFDELNNRSMISVYVGFDIPDQALPMEGTGFIVGKDSELTCNACTWTSRKWAHTSKNQRLLIRLFYKSSNPHYSALIELPEDQLKEVALWDAKLSLGITGDPVTCEITKWHDSMPNYHLKHPGIVRSLERKMELYYPGVFLAGCSYYGVGIADCIANGEQTAERIAKRLEPND
ncbi:protoporphyrinogen oxidase [Paenibacillus marinisediminis]